MRNPNGYGGVYKLSGKRRRPFVVSITIGYDDLTGKQKRQILGYYATRKEAMQALADYNTNGIVIKSEMTLEQIYKDWSEKRFAQSSIQGIRCDKMAWQKLSDLHKKAITEIRTAELQKVIDDNANLSISSLKKIKTLAGQLFKYAMQNDIVQKNYAQFIEICTKNKTPEEKKIFTELQLQQIEKLARQELSNGQPLHFGSILILCYTGFRISEFLQLTNPFSLVRDDQQQIIALQGGLKTEAGKNRIVPLHPKIKPYIDYLVAEKKQYLYTKTGKIMSGHYYRHFIWKPCLEKLNIKNMTPHNCRHTFASLCERAELSPVKIEKLMGHTNYQMSKHYTHTEMQDLQSAVSKL